MTIRVAFSLDRPPYVNRSTESGLEVEILRRIFLDMGYDMSPVFQPPARSVRSLELGRVDAMATITNMPRFYLSDPYIIFKNFAWTLKSRKIHLKDLEDLGRYRVIAFQNARHFFGSDFDKAVAKNSNYEEYADQNRHIRMLFSERVDVIICEERTLKTNQMGLEANKGPLPDLQKHALFGESHPKLIREGLNDSENTHHSGHLLKHGSIFYGQREICQDFKTVINHLTGVAPMGDFFAKNSALHKTFVVFRVILATLKCF